MKPISRQAMIECNLAALSILVLALSMAFASLSPNAKAQEPLTFDPSAPQVDLNFRRTGYWLIREDDPMYAPYKNPILVKWQDALRQRGITDQGELQLLTAQALQENGALDPERTGDHGCSLGLPQRNFCSHAGILAKKALQKWPEWHDLDFQIGWFADATKQNLDQYGDIKWAIIDHNRPASAAHRETTQYWYDVNARLPSLEWVI